MPRHSYYIQLTTFFAKISKNGPFVDMRRANHIFDLNAQNAHINHQHEANHNSKRPHLHLFILLEIRIFVLINMSLNRKMRKRVFGAFVKGRTKKNQMWGLGFNSVILVKENKMGKPKCRKWGALWKSVYFGCNDI